MTRPRSERIDREEGGFYHLGSRCVRRAMLYGEDPVTGRDVSHRRAWIEDRLLELAEIFTVHVCAYAVMSNHYHVTVDYRPRERLEFSDEEVAERWLRLFPPQPGAALESAVTALLEDPERLAVLRDRLGDLSWYMRCLNEPIARLANREDDCTGRFWQGRFCSKELPNDRSVWACMAYDDLNPLRAGMAETVDAPEHTVAAAPPGGSRRRTRAARRAPRAVGASRWQGGQRANPRTPPRHDAARLSRPRRMDRRQPVPCAREQGARTPGPTARPHVVARPGGVTSPAPPHAHAATLGPRERRSRHSVDRTEQSRRRVLASLTGTTLGHAPWRPARKSVLRHVHIASARRGPFRSSALAASRRRMPALCAEKLAVPCVTSTLQRRSRGRVSRGSACWCLQAHSSLRVGVPSEAEGGCPLEGGTRTRGRLYAVPQEIALRISVLNSAVSQLPRNVVGVTPSGVTDSSTKGWELERDEWVWPRAT